MNESFTISDFKGVREGTIRDALSRELGSWRHTSVWWKPKRAREFSPTHREMAGWCKAFVRFYAAVIVRKEPIDTAFCAWVNEHSEVQGENPGLTDFDEASKTKHVTVPHLQFLAAYESHRGALQMIRQEELQDA